MIEGYTDLRNELVEIFGGHLTQEDIDVAVEAIIEEERTTATPALAELNALAQSQEGKEKLRSLLANWITHERDKHAADKEQAAKLALNHLLECLHAERRHESR
jgi:RNase H-fold protein (predicted Holliday junction resolvase)